MAAFVLSQVIGLVRQILISSAFGTGSEIDAFNAASRLPDLLFNLVAAGALASAFIPTFTGFLTRKDQTGAWQLASSITNLVALVMASLSLLGMIFAPLIVRYGIYLIVPDLDPAKEELTIQLLRILLITPVIFGISGLLMGILNAHQIFFLPAIAPTMYWSGMIFGVLFLTPSMGIYGLAWGAVLGSMLHLAIQLPALARISWRYFPFLGLHLPAVREVGRLMAPRLLGVAVVQLNLWINVVLASAMPVGSLTAILTAWMLMTVPQVVIAQSIAIAALPTFSAQFASGRMDDMRASLAATLRSVLLLSVPATFGLILMRRPVIVLLFQHGEFNAHSTDLVAWALLWYAAGLVGHSVVEIVARAFYALHDTRTPVIVGTAAMSLNLVFSIAFSALFVKLAWPPHGGLALANSVATALEMAGLLVLMRRRLNGLDGAYILSGLAKTALATMMMSLVLWAWLALTTSQPVWLVVLGGVSLGALVFGLLVVALRVPEALDLIGVFRRRQK